MIRPDKYRQAKRTIDTYENQLSVKFVQNYTCICCKKAILEPIWDLPPATEQHQGIWRDGTVSLVSFGFGSRRDMESFFVAICDDCIEEAEKLGIVVNYGELRKCVEDTKNYEGRIYDGEIDQDDDVMTIEEWEEASNETGCICSDDGSGYWCKGGKRSDDEVFGSQQLDATHVVWYNK